MEQFSIGPIYILAGLLSKLKTAAEAYKDATQKERRTDYLPLFFKKQISRNLRRVQAELKRLDLKVSGECIYEAQLDLKRELVTPEDLGRIYTELDNTIQREMR